MSTNVPGSQSAHSAEASSLYASDQRRKRNGLAILALLYGLIIIALLLIESPLIGLALPIFPILLAAMLFGVSGGLAGAVLGTFVVGLNVTMAAGWPLPGQSAAMLILSAASFFGLGALAGWISRREGRQQSLLQAALAEVDAHRDLFMTIMQSASIAAIIADEGGRIMSVNRAATEALGIKSPVALGQELANLGSDMRLADLFYKSTLGNAPVTGEVDGADDRTLVANISPVPGLGSVGVFQDFTYVNTLDARKQKLMSIVSHDLKNPLSAIQGYADLVLKTAGLDERQRGFMERIRLAATRVIERVKDHFDVAWIEVGMEYRQERIALSTLVQEVVQQHKTAVSAASISLAVSLPDSEGEAHVMGDADRLRHAVDTLVGNALRYAGTGGEVTVSLRHEADNAIFRVQDSGGGIVEEDLSMLFERSFRFDDTSEQHTGLTLAIVRALVEHYGGTIQAQRNSDKGSTLEIQLPLAR